MCISNLVIKLNPEEIPEFLRGKFFELNEPEKYDKDYVLISGGYVGWVFIKNDGTIEFGEPGV